MLIYTPRMRPQLWPNSVVTSANYTADLRIDYAATAGEALAMTDSTVDRNVLRVTGRIPKYTVLPRPLPGRLSLCSRA